MLVFGIEKMPKGIIRSRFFDPWREQAGLAATPAYFALRAQRLMLDSGITKEQLAAVVVKNRGQGVHNENAMFRKAVTVEDVLASKVVCEPLHLFMLCSPNEGAAAVVLAGRRPAACSCGPRRCAATCPVTCSTRGRPCPGWSTTPTSRRRPRWPADDAYAAAGLGPDDIDVAECQDTDAARELLAYIELGLCAPGDVGRMVAEGTTAMGGRIPVNPSGGLLSKGEPLGASAIGQVVELTHQLQGTVRDAAGRGRPQVAWPTPSAAAPTPASRSSAADPDSRDGGSGTSGPLLL